MVPGRLRRASRARAALGAAALLAACGHAPSSPPHDRKVAGTPLPAPAEVADCRPCIVPLGGEPGDLVLTFDLATTAAGERSIRAVLVERSDRRGPGQRLMVEDMEPVPPGEAFFVGPDDINFDGRADLLLAVARGVANTYAQYWRFEPAADRFVPVGTFPILTPDPASRRLTAYERGGMGGLAYTRTEYAWTEGRLEPQRVEEQGPTEDAAQLRRVVRERRTDGMLAIVEDTRRPMP